MNRGIWLAVVLLVLTLCQCDRRPEPQAAVAAPGPSAYAFDINLKITPEAVALMQQRDSHFVVAALYFGRPKPEHRHEANPQGRIRLGYELVGMAKGAERVHLPAAVIDTRLLGSINGGPHTMVSIYSATGSGVRDGLVRCKTYFGIIATARAKSPTVHCYVNTP